MGMVCEWLAIVFFVLDVLGFRCGVCLTTLPSPPEQQQLEILSCD